jgi:hypothetical protein
MIHFEVLHLTWGIEMVFGWVLRLCFDPAMLYPRPLSLAATLFGDLTPPYQLNLYVQVRRP